MTVHLFSTVALAFFLVLARGEIDDRYTIVHNNQTLLILNDTGTLFTCGLINVCAKLDKGVQSLFVNEASLSISDGNSVLLPGNTD